MSDPRTAFLTAALWHGDLLRANAILGAEPGLDVYDVHTAAVVGNDAAVRWFLAADPACVTAKVAPYGGDPLVYLCLSKYLRLDPSRSDAFLRAATALLDAGADPDTGFWTTGNHPEFETALYGAAGVARHAGLTRLLLERGADPNDDEVPYHAPEGYDNAALEVLVESGRLTADSLVTMLLRKADWHDHDGVVYLLEKGADPDRVTRWGYTALHQAVRRDNALATVEALLDRGADPLRPDRDGRSAVATAARRGRRDVLEALDRRGVSTELAGVERLIAACARGDAGAVRAVAGAEPHLVGGLLAEGGTLLAGFAGAANADGVRCLLDLGVDVAARSAGDGYFDVAPDSTALHVAAWRAWPAVVKLLIDRGAPADLPDGRGRTPLALAAKACVDSYWEHRRSPESVALLLAAGASPASVVTPTGYAEVDELLRAAAR